MNNKKKSSKPLSKQTKINIGIAVLFFVLVASVYGALCVHYNNKLKEQKQNYETQLATANTTISSNKRTAYEPSGSSAIQAGDVITSDKVQQVTVFSDVSQDQFMTEADIGKIARIDLEPGIPIYLEELAESTVPYEVIDGDSTAQIQDAGVNYNEIQEVEVNYIKLNSNMQDNDFVDIRIKFPNGEDYVVIAKQSLRSLDLAAVDFYLWLTEEQITSLNGACVDANLHGGELYVTKYVEPSIQEASIVNYQPPVDVMQLMATDPNIVDLSQRNLSVIARSEMEERLKVFEETSGEDVSTTGQKSVAPNVAPSADNSSSITVNGGNGGNGGTTSNNAASGSTSTNSGGDSNIFTTVN